MSRLLFLSITTFIFAAQAHAQVVAGCAMAHGSMVHSISSIDKKLTGTFALPSFRDFKKDPSGQTRTLNAPLSNDSLFSDNLSFLKEKQEVLEKIFGDRFALSVEFDVCELQQSADESLSAWFCSKNSPTTINGVHLNRIEFSIQNQIRTSLVGSQGATAQTEVVYADLLFTTVANAQGIAKAYKSSFSYFPNGDSVQCSLTPDS